MAARRPLLRSADGLVAPALAETVKALDPPESDAALVRLAEVTAAAIDAMPVEVKGAMLGQTAPLLLKLLQELDQRADRRRKPVKGPPSRLDQLRAARNSGRAPNFL
jgi:hypothetical protein